MLVFLLLTQIQLSKTEKKILWVDDFDELDDVKPQNIKANVNCTGQNTIKNAMGKCECLPGYPHGNASSAAGCWKCQKICHSYANCSFPGICVCNDGYQGDGITKCKPILPHITKVNPSEGYSGTVVNVSFENIGNYSLERAFCRFGALIIETSYVRKGYLLCSAPFRSKSITVPLAISFDAIKWSNEDVVFQYMHKESFMSFFPKIFMIVTFTCLIGFLIYSYMTGSFRKSEKDDEEVPFVKSTKKFDRDINKIRRRVPML